MISITVSNEVQSTALQWKAILSAVEYVVSYRMLP